MYILGYGKSFIQKYQPFLAFLLILTILVRSSSPLMNLLQIFFITSGAILIVLGFDIAHRQKFNALHFLVFIAVGLGLFIFTIFPETLNMIGRIVGLQRGADALVYASIIFLMYFSLLLLRKVEWQREETTALLREITLLRYEMEQMSRGSESSRWVEKKEKNTKAS